MIRQDRGDSREETPETIRPNPEFQPELHANPDSDVRPFEVVNPGWSIVGVARQVGENESIFDLNHSGVSWREIDDSSQLDPPTQKYRYNGGPVDTGD